MPVGQPPEQQQRQQNTAGMGGEDDRQHSGIEGKPVLVEPVERRRQGRPEHDHQVGVCDRPEHGSPRSESNRGCGSGPLVDQPTSGAGARCRTDRARLVPSPDGENSGLPA